MSTYIERAEQWEARARESLETAAEMLEAGKPTDASFAARRASEQLFKATGERYYADRAAEARTSDKTRVNDEPCHYCAGAKTVCAECEEPDCPQAKPCHVCGGAGRAGSGTSIGETE